MPPKRALLGVICRAWHCLLRAANLYDFLGVFQRIHWPSSVTKGFWVMHNVEALFPDFTQRPDWEAGEVFNDPRMWRVSRLLLMQLSPRPSLLSCQQISRIIEASRGAGCWLGMTGWRREQKSMVNLRSRGRGWGRRWELGEMTMLCRAWSREELACGIKSSFAPKTEWKQLHSGVAQWGGDSRVNTLKPPWDKTSGQLLQFTRNADALLRHSPCECLCLPPPCAPSMCVCFVCCFTFWYLELLLFPGCSLSGLSISTPGVGHCQFTLLCI